VLDEVSAAILGGVAAENAKDELTQKPPNALNLQKNRLGFCGQLNPFVRQTS
jgi:hypothetical protein